MRDARAWLARQGIVIELEGIVDARLVRWYLRKPNGGSMQVCFPPDTPAIEIIDMVETMLEPSL